jgi:hypothetical protein
MGEIYRQRQSIYQASGKKEPLQGGKQRKERFIAHRWDQIRRVVGWRFVILAEQIQMSWIRFDEERLVFRTFPLLTIIRFRLLIADKLSPHIQTVNRIFEDAHIEWMAKIWNVLELQTQVHS